MIIVGVSELEKKQLDRVGGNMFCPCQPKSVFIALKPVKSDRLLSFWIESSLKNQRTKKQHTKECVLYPTWNLAYIIISDLTLDIFSIK